VSGPAAAGDDAHDAVTVITRSAEETRALGASVASLLRPGDVVVLAGDLAAGKTTFAQGAIAALGVEEQVTSPTFTIVAEYEGRVRVAHVDVYRLSGVGELHDLGFEEVVDDERVTFVEWGDRVEGALPPDRLVVTLEVGAEPDERTVSVRAHGPRWLSQGDALAAAGVPRPPGSR